MCQQTMDSTGAVNKISTTDLRGAWELDTHAAWQLKQAYSFGRTAQDTKKQKRPLDVPQYTVELGYKNLSKGNTYTYEDQQ